MKLCLLRHGQTDWNLTDRIQGSTDVPLNETGREQARKAAPLLRKESFDAVFTSPLIRAVETEQIAYGSSAPLRDDRLREWDFGEMEGGTVTQGVFFLHFRRGADPIPGGESFEDVIGRARSFLDMLKEKYSDQSVLVVAHGAFFIALRTVVFGDPADGNYRNYLIPNCVPFFLDL